MVAPDMIWFCLASGPSMTQADADAVRGLGRVIAINNTVQLAPWADALYSCDPAWWRTYVALHEGFAGRKIALAHDWLPDGIEGIPYDADGYGLGIERVHTGHNSGYQAINWAWMQGATTIVLLGYDMDHGGEHWHPPHPAPLGNFARGMPELCIPKFAALAHDLAARNIRVINCSRHSALQCFERLTLRDALAQF